MKFKSAASMFMSKLFIALAIAGFMILGCASDFAPGYMKNYIWCCVGEAILIFFAVLFTNPKIFYRHLVAIYCTIRLIHGYIHNKHGETYRFLYDVADRSKSLFDFYSTILRIYDERC